MDRKVAKDLLHTRDWLDRDTLPRPCRLACPRGTPHPSAARLVPEQSDLA